MKVKDVRAGKPRTIQEANSRREVYTFYKGTLRCKKKRGTLKSEKKPLEIKEAWIGNTKPGEKPKYYKVPFTRAQAEEICATFGHIFAFR